MKYFISDTLCVYLYWNRGVNDDEETHTSKQKRWRDSLWLHRMIKVFSESFILSGCWHQYKETSKNKVNCETNHLTSRWWPWTCSFYSQLHVERLSSHSAKTHIYFNCHLITARSRFFSISRNFSFELLKNGLFWR